MESNWRWNRFDWGWNETIFRLCARVLSGPFAGWGAVRLEFSRHITLLHPPECAGPGGNAAVDLGSDLGQPFPWGFDVEPDTPP